MIPFRFTRGCAKIAAWASVLAVHLGCQAPVVVLNLIGIADKPLTITSVAERRYDYRGPLQVLDPFEQTRQLYEALGKAVHRAVVPDMCFEFQLAPNLALGTAQLADVSPLHYARIKDAEKFPVLAVATDPQGRVGRPALLVVSASSGISDIGALRGKTVAFGPARDARTHHAGLLLLRENGVRRGDLSLELFPVPGSLKTFPNGPDVLQSVLNNSSDAGFVDELYWESLPETADAPNAIAKSGFRVVSKTMPVVERLILRSPSLDEATTQQVTQFLMTAGDRHPAALKHMQYGGFATPSADLLEQCRRLLAVDPPTASQPSN